MSGSFLKEGKTSREPGVDVQAPDQSTKIGSILWTQLFFLGPCSSMPPNNPLKSSAQAQIAVRSLPTVPGPLIAACRGDFSGLQSWGVLYVQHKQKRPQVSGRYRQSTGPWRRGWDSL